MDMTQVNVLKLEDAVTEHVAHFFRALSATSYLEDRSLTNERLPQLANDLAAIAQVHGVPLETSTPRIVDTWQNYIAAPSTYSIQVHYEAAGIAEIFVPVLPRDAA